MGEKEPTIREALRLGLRDSLSFHVDRQAHLPPATPPESTHNTSPPTSEQLDARAKLLNRRAWIIFALSLPLTVAAGFLGGLPYALARGIGIWGFSLGLTAILSLIPGIVVAVTRRSALARAQIAFGISVVLIGVVLCTALFGGYP